MIKFVFFSHIFSRVFFCTPYELTHLFELRRVARDVNLIVLVVRRLLQNLIEDVEYVDPVKEFALAKCPRFDFAQLIDEFTATAGLQLVDEILTFGRNFGCSLLQPARVHLHGDG